PAGLHHLLQPPEPDAVLGDERPHERRRRARGPARGRLPRRDGPAVVARPRQRHPSAAPAAAAEGSPMRTVRHLIYRDVFWSVFFVAVAFLSLFFFIDFVDEAEKVGRNGYTLLFAAIAAVLEQPGHVYELFPIAVLIGTIYSMARLAQSSEYTIL